MACLAQTAHTVISELKALGLEIPKGAHKFSITCEKPYDPVFIVFEILNLDNDVVFTDKVQIMNSQGFNLSVQEFCKLIKDAAQLPDETVSFKISGRTNEVVMVKIEAALPQDSFKALKGCTFKT